MTRRRSGFPPTHAGALFGATVVFVAFAACGGWGTAHGPRPTTHAASPWSHLLRDHLARYPLAEAEDVYKLVHQSVFGPAHAVPSRDEAKRYLDEELAALAPGPAGEPLLDVLSDTPPLARLNLRPFVAAGGDRARLLDAFVATAATVHGDAAVMKEHLEIAIAVLRDLGREAMARQLDVLADDDALHGYPAGHHSATYRNAYHPAYRVVLQSLLTDVAPGTPGGATAK